MLKMLDYVFLVSPSVALHDSSNVLTTDIQHTFNFLWGKQLIESTQFKVSFLVRDILFEAN